MMQFKRKYWIGIGIGLFILLVDLAVYYGTKWFVPILVIAVTVTWAQYWADYFQRVQKEKLYEGKFLEFVRNITSAVKSGMPVSKAIVHVSRQDYGPLAEHIRKLAHQVEWAIPLHKALMNFAVSTKNPVIKRAIATVIEAERSGGNMEDVLGSITESLVEIKKIKLSRRANIQGQIIQSYIIFFVFLAVMIVIQNMLIPYLSGVSANIPAGTISETASFNLEQAVKIEVTSVPAFVLSVGDWLGSLKGVLLMLPMIQGLFAGMVLGKLSEGDMVSGLKHSLILMTLALLIMSLSQGWAG